MLPVLLIQVMFAIGLGIVLGVFNVFSATWASCLPW